MSALRNVEDAISGFVDRVFGRLFRGYVEPVELARKLAREMEDHKTVSVSRVYVPNEYVVYLSQPDRSRFASFEGSLTAELGVYVAERARHEGFTLLSTPQVRLETDTDLRIGEYGISCRVVDPPAEPPAAESADAPAIDVEAAYGSAPFAPYEPDASIATPGSADGAAEDDDDADENGQDGDVDDAVGAAEDVDGATEVEDEDEDDSPEDADEDLDDEDSDELAAEAPHADTDDDEDDPFVTAPPASPSAAGAVPAIDGGAVAASDPLDAVGDAAPARENPWEDDSVDDGPPPVTEAEPEPDAVADRPAAEPSIVLPDPDTSPAADIAADGPPIEAAASASGPVLGDEPELAAIPLPPAPEPLPPPSPPAPQPSPPPPAPEPPKPAPPLPTPGGYEPLAGVSGTQIFSAADAAAEGLLQEEVSLIIDGRRQQLTKRTSTLGRSRDCDISLADPNASRQHAEIRHIGLDYFVVDMGSTNGTFVNGQRVRRHALADGDRLTIGTTEMIVEYRQTGNA